MEATTDVVSCLLNEQKGWWADFNAPLLQSYSLFIYRMYNITQKVSFQPFLVELKAIMWYTRNPRALKEELSKYCRLIWFDLVSNWIWNQQKIHWTYFLINAYIIKTMMFHQISTLVALCLGNLRFIRVCHCNLHYLCLLHI